MVRYKSKVKYKLCACMCTYIYIWAISAIEKYNIGVYIYIKPDCYIIIIIRKKVAVSHKFFTKYIRVRSNEAKIILFAFIWLLGMDYFCY